MTLSQSVSQSASHPVASHGFDKSYVYCELGGLDESRGVSDGMQSHAKPLKVMQSHARSCKVMQSHVKAYKGMQSHAK